MMRAEEARRIASSNAEYQARRVLERVHAAAVGGMDSIMVGDIAPGRGNPVWAVLEKLGYSIRAVSTDRHTATEVRWAGDDGE